ncbi:hypothetical protein E5288_WYG018852 [Bos mutus]|uniref:Uncharacterized protein n=1 Tax=Bos mutus TaxID=72004 RepID=A0A6B0R5R1_9CETA|nr:hypothetical protein [Bos mutus]
MSNYQLSDDALIEYGYYPGLIGNEGFTRPQLIEDLEGRWEVREAPNRSYLLLPIGPRLERRRESADSGPWGLVNGNWPKPAK